MDLSLLGMIVSVQCKVRRLGSVSTPSRQRARRTLRLDSFLPLGAIVLLLSFAQTARSQIRIQCGKKCPVMTPGQIGRTSIGASFIDGKPHDFNSIGAPEGSVITNQADSGATITGFKMTLPPGQTWDPHSSPGDLFTKQEITDGGRTITLTGGNIPPGTTFWLQMPNVPATTGNPVGTVLTAAPVVPPPPPIVPIKPGLSIGTKPGAAVMSFDGSSTLSFDPGPVTFVQYLDGSMATTNGPFEKIIGDDFTLTPVHVIGPAQGIPGGFELSDSVLEIGNGTSDQFLASLTQVRLIPDHNTPGFDSLLEATVEFRQGVPESGSQFVDQFFANGDGGAPTELLFHSSIFGATGDLSQQGQSTGTVVMNSSIVPEPSSLLLFGTGGLVPLACALRRRKKAA